MVAWPGNNARIKTKITQTNLYPSDLITLSISSRFWPACKPVWFLV